MRMLFCSLLMVFSIILPAYAETILLKNGKIVNAKITERLDSSIKIDFFGVTLTYYYDQIESIDGEIVRQQVKKKNTAVTNTIQVKEEQCGKIIEGILSLRNSDSNLLPSHWGHPGYDDLGFLYDEAITALILKTYGHQQEAEDILDYLVSRLMIPENTITSRMDTNGIYGIIKVFPLENNPAAATRSIVNAIDVSSVRKQGKCLLEIWTTPGPTSFLIFALLHTNPDKYKYAAILLGETLLTMQNSDGGVKDGDRSPGRIHTEPHVDTSAAFLMLYQITGEKKWKNAAESADEWFERYVYHPKEGIIDQGLWGNKPSVIFATDVYSWTMASPSGDVMPLDVIKKLTENMLRQNLVAIVVSLPDGNTREVILCDFSNPELDSVKQVRNGFHPLGSVEWTGGVILSLQKNAVRFWNAGDAQTSRHYKALAEILFKETMKCFYPLPWHEGLFTFYATGQGIEVGPFGSLESDIVHGWNTPFYYAKDNDGSVGVKGGSVVGAWPLLPYLGVNPFILGDTYHETYEQIPCGPDDTASAMRFINEVVTDRKFKEVVPTNYPDARTQIVEPGAFNKYMWIALENAETAKRNDDIESARQYFLEAKTWADKVINNRYWVELARRDNMIKQQEVGGIIAYPWGTVYPDNDNYLHYKILRYPLLNEVATSVWALAVINFELDNLKEAKNYIKQLINEFPLHQIADTNTLDRDKGLIQGYWNALVSWEENTGEYERDRKMGILYKEVLQEEKLANVKPKLIVLKEPGF